MFSCMGCYADPYKTPTHLLKIIHFIYIQGILFEKAYEFENYLTLTFRKKSIKSSKINF